MLVVLYVDDVGIACYYTTHQDLNDLLNNLTKCGLEFTREGTFTDFLGIKFVKDETNNAVTLTWKDSSRKLSKSLA